MSGSRIVRVKIEMDLVEGEHFWPPEIYGSETSDSSDNEAREAAEASFINTLDQLGNDKWDWIQSEVVK